MPASRVVGKIRRRSQFVARRLTGHKIGDPGTPLSRDISRRILSNKKNKGFRKRVATELKTLKKKNLGF